MTYYFKILMINIKLTLLDLINWRTGSNFVAKINILILYQIQVIFCFICMYKNIRPNVILNEHYR